MARIPKCELCGNTFECEGILSFGCWCSETITTKEKRERLRTESTDCVCPDCL
ncbi:MAG: cysteine-rich CWC family protein [Nitrososphaerales archaeon]